MVRCLLLRDACTGSHALIIKNIFIIEEHRDV